VLVIAADPAGGEQVAHWFLALDEGRTPLPA
jgi:hypothetical protein